MDFVLAKTALLWIFVRGRISRHGHYRDITVWTDGWMPWRPASGAVRGVGRGENTTDPRRGCDNAPPETRTGRRWQAARRQAAARNQPALTSRSTVRRFWRSSSS
ncbi:hypothetical protein C5O75_030295 [Burkholderia cepacia]|nr:hypothetical protein C5O75_030295 [Burkholderia cepacia]